MSPSTSAGSVRHALGAATDALSAAGIADARLDAELLLAEAMACDRARLAADAEAGVPPPAARSFGQMVRRRLRREPVAYILGRRGFRRIELAVDPRALIPRPETELLVEVAVELGPETVLEVGTGSGAVALALCDELPVVKVTATDTSAAALALARENANALGFAERVSFILGDVPLGERVDLVLANLPYVSRRELGALAPEIQNWEPREALLGGDDGLDEIRGLLRSLSQGPRPSALALEVGAGQAERVGELMSGSGYRGIEARLDLAGVQRVVLGHG